MFRMVRNVGLFLVASAPSVAFAPVSCWELDHDNTGCGGSGTATICEAKYVRVFSGGRQFTTRFVKPKWCCEYPAGSHTTTPCSVPPPDGYRRPFDNDAPNGICCDV